MDLINLTTSTINEKPPSWLKSGKAANLEPGEYKCIEDRIRSMVNTETPVLLYYAFDRRTRVGPFVGPDISMPNCGIRAVGGAMYKAGFKNTRVIFGPWNPNFDFRYAKLDGKTPQIFGIGSMQIHEADAHEKIRQANSLNGDRPLIIGGGPHANYQAYDYFNPNPKESVDVAVRGELNVTLALLEIILTHKGEKETMLQGYERARDEGALNTIKGIMYVAKDRGALIDTGKPLQVLDFDEFPREIIGLGLLEPKHKGKGLRNAPVPLDKLKDQGLETVSTLTTAGCNFNCSYCPIPKMHQFSERAKSPARMVSEFKEILEEVGPVMFFGTDDNAFAYGKEQLVDLYTKMAQATVNGKPFRDTVWYGTEATEHQASLYKDLFPLMRAGGLRAIWFGIEDLTAELVKKGQNPDKTIEVFKLLNENGISPMPMMMHFDKQPLRGPKGKLEGILDQIDFLREHGANSVQITYNSPSIGSEDYKKHFENGRVLAKAGKMDVESYLFDGNHVVSTTDENPVKRQDNIIAAYDSFYNLRNYFQAFGSYARARLTKNKTALDVASTGFVMQIHGRRALRISRRNIEEWRKNLATKVFEFAKAPPESSIPILSVE